MTTTPYVELRFNPTDLRPRDLPKIGEFLGTPSDAIEAALMAARMRMIYEMKTEVRSLVEPTEASLLRAADLAWQAVFWRYRKISAPMMADAYIRAYRAAGAGDVPMSVIYDLADKHAEKIGDYFHGTSRDALAEGFNTLVNRRIPAKAAADRVLDAYGLTPRQMRGYTSNKQLDGAGGVDLSVRREGSRAGLHRQVLHHPSPEAGSPGGAQHRRAGEAVRLDVDAGQGPAQPQGPEDVDHRQGRAGLPGVRTAARSEGAGSTNSSRPTSDSSGHPVCTRTAGAWCG